VIRADASLTIGTGHVMRSLTLADALRRRAVSVTFVCRQHHGHLSDLIAQRGFDVVRLPEPLAGVRSSMVGGHEGWLGAAWDDDATQTRAAIERLGRRPDWLVVDHYAIDHRWEGALRPSVERIFVIDDLADRPHDCDLLLDQNLFAEMQSRYDDKVPRGCPLMLGPQFALLQPVYGELHRRMPPRAGLIQHLLIFFGGADRENLAGRSLSAVLSLKRTDLEVDVVITANCPHADSIRKQVAEHNHVHLHVGVPTLAPFIS
jgi:UDP-2,4-diacetamido-2,4,6-trideoxy-beta-L-altropyranose hydrolase